MRTIAAGEFKQTCLRLLEEVRETVRGLIDTLGKDGGYVMAPAHEMQDDIPPENIVAWVEASRAGADR